MNIKLLVTFIFFLTFSGLLSACNKTDSPKQVSQKFWQAVQERDMETAKILATWDSVEYLKYLNSDKFHPERFEIGEVMSGEKKAEVETVLYTSKPGTSGVKLPGMTVMVLTEHGWRVNVKSSVASVVKHSTNTMFDQLNKLMQEGIKDLDKSLSGVFDELGQALEQGAEELKQELSKPLLKPDSLFDKPLEKLKPNLDKAQGQQI